MTAQAASDAVREMDGPLDRLHNQLRMIRCAVIGAASDPIGDPGKLSLHAIADHCLDAEITLGQIVQHWAMASHLSRPIMLNKGHGSEN